MTYFITPKVNLTFDFDLKKKKIKKKINKIRKKHLTYFMTPDNLTFDFDVKKILKKLKKKLKSKENKKKIKKTLDLLYYP